MAIISRPKSARIEYPIGPKFDQYGLATIIEKDDGTLELNLNGVVINLTWPEYEAVIALKSMIMLAKPEKQ